MMKLWRSLELEWRILILACLFFVAFAWPVQRILSRSLTTSLQQSVDPRLDSLLRTRLERAGEGDRQALVRALERHRQWQAMIPVIVGEQRRAVVWFSVVTFGGLALIAVWVLRRMTRPLKEVASAVDRIGGGEQVSLACGSGGALGRVERSVVQLQEELRILREQSRIQGMETAWKEIARVMAHEIKNPLTPLRLSLDRMEERLHVSGEGLPETFGGLVERMNAQVDALERLVDQFRSFSRAPEVRLREVALENVVHKTGDDMAGALRTEVRGAASVKADPLLLGQILLNLWKNAREADADTVRVAIAARDDRAEVSISDNGRGIPAEHLSRVWLPYVSYKSRGTGLGLAVVKRMVETMGGEVSLRSPGDGGGGTTVKLVLLIDPMGETRNGD